MRDSANAPPGSTSGSTLVTGAPSKVESQSDSEPAKSADTSVSMSFQGTGLNEPDGVPISSRYKQTPYGSTDMTDAVYDWRVANGEWGGNVAAFKHKDGSTHGYERNPLRG